MISNLLGTKLYQPSPPSKRVQRTNLIHTLTENLAARCLRLFITLNTVRFYVKEIYSKLNVNNRTQAIEVAHKHNLL